MPDRSARLEAQKQASTVLVLFIPSVDRFDEPIDQQHWPELREFLVRMGQEARQGAVGLVIDRDYLEIRFPLEDR